MRRKEDQRRMYAEKRAREGLPPAKEPDEQKGPAAVKGKEERFPGDAGTMAEKNNRQEVRACVCLRVRVLGVPTRVLERAMCVGVGGSCFVVPCVRALGEHGCWWALL